MFKQFSKGAVAMKVETVDLYEYFNFSKPKDTKGLLTIYALDNNSETGLKRERSAMLVIPGGGYTFVSSREGESVAISYVSRGIQSFVLDYSTGPSFVYPVHLREAAMAMIFIRENAKKYHVDPETVGCIGFSAGGHLCGCLGNAFNSPDIADLRNCDFVRPTAIILSYPVTIYSPEIHSHRGSFINLTAGNHELAKTLALDKLVTKLSSPAFMWHTVTDELVPVYGTIELSRVYHDHNVPFELHLFANGQHGLSIATDEVNSPNESVQPWFDLSVTWLKSRGFKIYS